MKLLLYVTKFCLTLKIKKKTKKKLEFSEYSTLINFIKKKVTQKIYN